MSCREIERLFLSGASETERRTHRAGCRDCEALGRDADSGETLSAGLAPATWSVALRESLLSIPSRTVDCDAAAEMIGRLLETDAAEAGSPTGAFGALTAPEAGRLQFHLTRCAGCSEAHHVLSSARDLTSPAAAPWLSTRIAAAKPQAPRSRWRGFLSARAAISVAYALALVVMLAGFNPADLARKAGTGLRSETRTAAAVADRSLADRVGALEDQVARRFAVWRGVAGGYGRAVLSNVIALVMKSEDSSRPPSRPRNGEERSVPQNETAIRTWRA
jgi:hypothetical protein